MSRTSEVLASRDFWIGDLDARAPAVFRVALGVLVLADLGARLGDFHSFYSTAGLATAARPWPGEVLRWSLFHLARTPGQGLALFVAALAAAACFTVGYRTRVATVALWVLMVSVFNRNPFVVDGGDAVVLVLLFWAMFADLGGRASLDVRLRRRPPAAAVPAAPLRFIQLQVAYIYLITFIAKTGTTWWGGNAVLLVTGSPEWGRGIAPLVAASPALCAALTWGTLLIEVTFPFLALSPWSRARALALASGLALHAGIFLTMRVGIFSLVMPVSYLVFVRGPWLDRVLRPAVEPPSASTSLGRRVALAGTLTVPFLAIVGAQAWLTIHDRPAVSVAQGLQALGHHQQWYMFSPDVPGYSVRMEGPGALVDGTPIDAVSAVAPALASSHGFVYRRWYKLRQNLRRQSPEVLLAFGRLVCRRYNGERPGPRLARFELRAILTPVAPLSGTVQTEVLLRQDCLATAPRSGG